MMKLTIFFAEKIDFAIEKFTKKITVNITNITKKNL